MSDRSHVLHVQSFELDVVSQEDEVRVAMRSSIDNPQIERRHRIHGQHRGVRVIHRRPLPGDRNPVMSRTQSDDRHVPVL